MYRFYSLLTLLFFSILPASQADLRVDITQGRMEPLPIAIVPFIAEGGGLFSSSPDKLAQDITEVMTNDLRHCGLFRPIDKSAFLQRAQDVLVQPRFSDWRIIQAQALTVGKIINEGGDKFRVEFRLFDVFSERQIAGVAFKGTNKDWRRIAHKIADLVYSKLTGEDGYFDTKIVYVAETFEKKGRKTRLAMMDQDGANHQYLSDNKSLVLTPRFSPSVQQVAYMDYGHKYEPAVYIMDVLRHTKRRVGTFHGMTFAPRFSPDGQTVIMSLSQYGNSSLYKMNLTNASVQRLTFGSVIDTSASYSPDGNQIVFNSDRSGSQQLYVMDKDGGGVQRISFGQGRYATPVWSPRGDLIAFTKMYNRRFYIGVMRPDGSGERLLTESRLVEEPSWAPNGRVLIYNKEVPSYNGRGTVNRLYMIDLTGYNERIVPTPANEGAISAAWSPQLP